MSGFNEKPEGNDLISPLSFSRKGQGLFALMERLPQPIIAAIHGYCVGGGLDLALACDIRIATADAKFGHPGVRMGIITGWGGTQRLPRLIGKLRAKETLYSCDLLDAAEAYRIGLVDRLVPPEKLLEESWKVAQTIVQAKARNVPFGPFVLREERGSSTNREP